jgi:hypothetical protein
LWLLTAGQRHGRFADYAESVHDFDWAEFYADFEGEGFFDWLRSQASPEFDGDRITKPGFTDVVLIDSRTGITEMGGVCTQQLADVVVAFSAPNLQNLLGVETMARSFRRQEILEFRKGKPEVLIVPSRVDASELESRNRFEKRLRDLEPVFIPAALASRKYGFWDLKIPYVPKFTYEEALTVWDDSSKARHIEAREMADAYRLLSMAVATLAPSSHPLNKWAIPNAASPIAKKRVYLTWTGHSGVAIANALRLRLEKEAPDLDLWLQQRDDSVPVSDAPASRDIAPSCMVLAVSAEAIESDWVRQEWREARRAGICVYTVYAGNLYSDAPRWMRKAKSFELNDHWHLLLQTLRGGCMALRAPFMAPDLPLAYVVRSSHLEQVRHALVTPSGDPNAVTCILHGAGGTGKSLIAAAACHESAIIDAFDDGILWVSLGLNPEIRESLTQLYAALTGERPTFANEQDACYQLGTKLGALKCLVVIDDVWNPDDVRWFTNAAKMSAFLITSRNTAAAPAAISIDLGPGMTLEESMRFLSEGLPVANPVQFRELADQLARFPLALQMARGLLMERVQRGESVESAGEYLLQLLARHGFQAFDAVNSSVEASLSQLSEPGRERFFALAVFPENQPIPIASAAALWGIEEFEAENLVQRLTRFSLLQFDPSSRTLSIHPVVRSFIQTAARTDAGSSAVERIAGADSTLISVEDHRGHLRYSVASGGSGFVGRIEIPVDSNLVYDLNSRLLDAEGIQDQLETGKALYELLIPSKVDVHISAERPLVFLTEGRAAAIAWEMLVRPGDGRPLGIEPGVARMFATLLGASSAVEAPVRRRAALLIADTTNDLPSLPGAQREIHSLGQFLMSQGWDVTRLVGPNIATRAAVMTNLLVREYDVVHFAGHDVYNPASPSSSGWAFAGGTIGAREIGQMKRVPRLVFSNSGEADASSASARRAGFPSSLAEAFLRQGAACFVGSSGAVDDVAAAAFALDLYSNLLTGQPMFAAMRNARRNNLERFSSVRSWGIYQHYGNPLFRLERSAPEERSQASNSGGGSHTVSPRP